MDALAGQGAFVGREEIDFAVSYMPFPRGVICQAARDRLSALRFPPVSRHVACCSWLGRVSIRRPATVHAIRTHRICGA